MAVEQKSSELGGYSPHSHHSLQSFTVQGRAAGMKSCDAASQDALYGATKKVS